MQAADLGLLRRKLELLDYREPLGEGSQELVARLVDDLIHTTESYRDIKTTLTARDRELSQHASKVRSPVPFSSAGQHRQDTLPTLTFRDLKQR